MILHLVRHGETEANRLGLALGRADVPLNKHGLWQAARLAEVLGAEPLAAVYSSPLQRALLTADAIAGPHELKVRQRPGLIEMDIGETDGLSFSEVRSRFPGLLETWVSPEGPDKPMPGGERLADVGTRAWDFLQSLAGQHSDETVCAVTHNFVILSVLTRALGIELTQFRRLRHVTAAISTLESREHGIRVRRLNDVCHLAANL